jgi:hypothetical protein
MRLDKSYFVGEIALPQLATMSAPIAGLASLATQITGENTLEWFIAKYEVEFLIKLLGHRIYEAYSEAMQAESPLQVWLDLDAQIYYTRGEFKFSPAANYVYFWAYRTSVTQGSMTGEVRHKPDFADIHGPYPKMRDAWNSMCDIVDNIRRWCWEHRDEIREAIGIESSPSTWSDVIPQHWTYWMGLRCVIHDDFRRIIEL